MKPPPLLWSSLIVSVALALAAPARTQTPAATSRIDGMVEQPCAPDAIGRTDSERALAAALVQDKAPDMAALTPALVAMAAKQKVEDARQARDWPNLCLYQQANADVLKGGGAKVVFLGDSITELWQAGDPSLFTGGVVDRGISGQTTPQILLRFYADVVALHPQVVHIMAGTNDVAGNTGPNRPEDFKANIRAMVDVAKANHIQVVLASIPPAAKFGWRPSVDPKSRIPELNAWLATYAKQRGLIYADYFSALVSPEGGMRKEDSRDGVHPLHGAYLRMSVVARQALAAARRR